MKGDEIFFDTNIIVYAFDASEKEKQSKCNNLVSRVFGGEIAGVISNQVLAEVFYVLTEKVKNPLDAKTARSAILNFIDSENWLKINYNEGTVERVVDTANNVKTDFWDILIAETMKENGIFKIVTEDENDFKKIPKIEVFNPLSK